MGLQEGEFRAALREWRPLLEVLVLQPNTLSPVGAAIHWIRSHGYSGPVSSTNRTCPTSRLWRLVPDLLAFRVALVTPRKQEISVDTKRRKQKQQQEEEKEELEEDEAFLIRKRNRSTIGNCMWMQTLPIIAQANILGFLSAEHKMFHAKDLELLALDLLSGVQQDFSVAHGAQHLLSKIGCSNKLIEVKDLKRLFTLPSWLLEYKSQPPVLPWMPATLLLETNTENQTCGSASENIKSGLDKSNYHQANNAPAMDVPVNEGTSHKDKEISQEGEDEFIGLKTPPHHSEGGKRSLEEQFPSTSSLKALQDQKDAEQSPLPSGGENSPLYALAQSFREAWLDRQPTLEDLHSFSTLPDTSTFLKLLKPWEMKDDIILSMAKVFLTKDSGFAWSAKILSYCLLPKMLHLEQPASRFLVSTVIEAAKVHPRAVVDALLIPLVLSETGPNKAQCDVINRMLKECLSDDHILSFCAKMFLSNRRQQLPFANPPFVQDFLSKSLVWSEPAWTILQNILSRPILLDEELLEALLNGCAEEVARFAKSLKFSNLLICLLSKLGRRLKPYKSMFQRITEQTETFMTKSLIAKSASL